MPYSLLGIVGRDLTEAQSSIPGSTVIDLPQGFQIVPLTRTLFAAFAELPDNQFSADGFSAFLSS